MTRHTYRPIDEIQLTPETPCRSHTDNLQGKQAAYIVSRMFNKGDA